MRQLASRFLALPQWRSVLALAPYAAAIGATSLWSGNYVVSKAILPSSSPLELAFWRWATAFLVLLPFGAPGLWGLRGRMLILLPRWLLLAAVGIAAANTCLYFALDQLATLDTLIAAGAKPVAIILLLILIARRSLSLRELAGTLMPALGLALIATQGRLVPLHGSWSPAGAWMFANVVLFALYSVLLARSAPAYATIASFTATVGLGVVILLPFYAVDVVQRGVALPDPQMFLSATYLGAGASALAYALWNWSVARLGAAETAPLLHFVPATGALEAVLMFGESIRAYHVTGALAIASGIAIFAWTGSRKPAVVEPVRLRS